MVTKNEIIKLIEAASRQALAQYNSDAERFDKLSPKKLLGAAQLNLYNERTIAYHFNKYIELSMIQNKRPYYFVSEARIKYKPSEAEVLKAEAEIKDLSKNLLRRYRSRGTIHLSPMHWLWCQVFTLGRFIVSSIKFPINLNISSWRRIF